ncbi:MAG: hypothetical protein EBR82_53840 [Caulobacteraceae bacterium]|nr:hypothetical protein [Caulobacteraceae bacterium]
MWNVFQAILDEGTDEEFEPIPVAIPCPHPKHSWEQLETLRLRAELGEELFHSEDNRQCATAEQSGYAIDMMKLHRIENKDQPKCERKPVLPRKCPTCGKKFTPLYSDKRRKHCSRGCYIAYLRRKTKHCKSVAV